jgi:hypothetical protein
MIAEHFISKESQGFAEEYHIKKISVGPFLTFLEKTIPSTETNFNWSFERLENINKLRFLILLTLKIGKAVEIGSHRIAPWERMVNRAGCYTEKALVKYNLACFSFLPQNPN